MVIVMKEVITMIIILFMATSILLMETKIWLMIRMDCNDINNHINK